MFENFLIEILGEELYLTLISNNPELVSFFIIIFFFMLLMLIFNLIQQIFSFGGKI